MRIDIHTHTVYDKIAPMVVAYMEEQVGYKAYTEETVTALLAQMDAVGIDKSVVQCTTDDASRVRKTNEWAQSVQSERVIMFGAMLPNVEDFATEVRKLKEGGFKGVKLHPAANEFFPDDKKMFPLYEEVGEDMIVLFHAGAFWFDGREPQYAAPRRIARVLDNFPKMKVIAPHFGGFMMLDESQEFLIGRNSYIDAAWTPTIRLIGSPSLVTEIIRKHGLEKVLYGSDFPFNKSPRGEIDYILNLPLSDAEKEGILGENARRLLDL